MNDKKTLVLSLKGGGLKGYLSVRLLGMLLRLYPKLLDKVILVAGTSVGAITAAGLSVGLSVEDIEGFYYGHAKKIFSRNPLTAAFKGRSPFGLFGSLYRTEPLAEALEGMLGDKKVSDCVIDPFIVSYSLSGDKAKFYDYMDEKALLRDICLRSAAIPWIFPILSDFLGYWLDGGVVANDPALMAIVQLVSRDLKYKMDLSDIKVLSIGTGTYQKQPFQLRGISGGAYGLAKKAPRLAGITLEAKDEAFAYAAEQLLPPDSYFCLDAETGKLPLDKLTTLGDIDVALAHGRASLRLMEAKAFLEKHFGD